MTITYEYRDQVVRPGQPLAVKFESKDGPSVTVIVDPDMMAALQVMKYRSLQVDKYFVIRRKARPIENEAFVAKLNRYVIKKILCIVSHRNPIEIKLKMLPALSKKPDFNELAKMLAENEEYLKREAELLC